MIEREKREKAEIERGRKREEERGRKKASDKEAEKCRERRRALHQLPIKLFTTTTNSKHVYPTDDAK